MLVLLVLCLQHDDRDMNDDWRGPRFRGRGRGGFTGAARGREFGQGFSRGGLADTRRRPPFRSRSPVSGSGG